MYIEILNKSIFTKFNYGLYEKTATNKSLRRVFSQMAQRLNYVVNPLAVGC